MKKTFGKFILPAIISLFVVACSSVDGNAKKAAQLQQQAKEYNRQQQHQQARQSSLEANKIIREYDKSDKSEEFHKAYSKYKREYR